MSELARHLSYTFAEYVALDDVSEEKLELINGEIYAVAHGTPEHGRLAMRLGRVLGNALGARPCEVYSSDVRIRVPATGLAAYPDLSVVCGPTEIDPENRNTIVNPVVLVEVLSDSSRKYDLTIKQSHYLRLPSLKDYLVVEQQEHLIHHFARNEDGSWTVRLLSPPDVVRLSIGVEFLVADVYKNMQIG